MTASTPASLAAGRYQLGEIIGHGGMAEVRLATDTRLGRQVAIKIMRSDLANDAIFLSRFRREAHSVALLNNPNIVSIYDTGEELVPDDNGNIERLPYLVMEYVKGQTLRDILKANGALSQHDAEQVMIGVLNALEYSHRMGIVHRDIKPGNIMISDQGVVKVMDFGIARALDDSAATMTQSQGVVGTAQYLSPEQARGENVDMRSDLYSAGCVLYEMLTGRPPFVGDSAVAIAYQHVSEVATPPSSIVPGLPKIWDSVCAKAMAKDRQNRYATATEFKHDVLAIRSGGVVNAAAFNPLTDLANLQARKAAEEATATMALPQLTTTQPFNPLSNPSNPENGDNRTRSERAQEERKKHKKKLAIIWSIIGGVVVLAVAAFLVWFFLFRAQPTAMATVPTIQSGMSETLIEERITDAGFKFKAADDNNSTQPKGTFTKQSPKGGTKAAVGSTVTVWFSTGPVSSKIPDVSGMTQEEATSALQSAGFSVGSTTSEMSGTIEKDHVTRTDPAAGTSQTKGTSVIIYISTGMMKVPDVTGQPQADAQKALNAAGFDSITIVEGNSDTVPAGSVISTDPAGNSIVEQGAPITVTISQGSQQGSIPAGLDSGTWTLSQVQKTLSDAGFTNINVVTSDGSDVPQGSDIWTVTKIVDTTTGKNLSEGGSIALSDTIEVTITNPNPDNPADGQSGTGDNSGTDGNTGTGNTTSN
jgi:serine/threonine-protein kinase